MIRPRLISVIAVAMLVPLASCGDDGPGSDSDSTVVIGVSTLGGQNWAPWLASEEEAYVTALTNDPLLDTDQETGEVRPGIATEWTLSDDGLTWDFKLRDDVEFQGGYGTVTAEDVKFSYEQVLQPESTQPYLDYLGLAVDGDIDNFEIVSDTEFKLHAKQSAFVLPTILSDSNFGLPIQSKKYWDEDPEKAAKQPLGSGPYEFVSSTPGVEVVLKAVDEHWRQTPAFTNMIFKIVDDSSAMMAGLRTGEIDWAIVDPNQIAEGRAAGLNELTVENVAHVNLDLGGQYYAIPEANDCDSPWVQCDNPDQARMVREAMSLAIDRQSILDKILYGAGRITYGGPFAYPEIPETYDDSWPKPEYDPELAKQKLADGGFPDGFDMKLWVYDDFPGGSAVSEAVAGYLEGIGIKVERVPTEYETEVRPAIIKPDTSGYAFLRGQSRALDIMQKIGGNGTKDALLKDYLYPAVDEAYQAMLQEPDKQKRDLIAREMTEKTWVQDILNPSLFLIDLTVMTSPKVGTWTPIPGSKDPQNLETLEPAA